jgi:hypothetical protein
MLGNTSTGMRVNAVTPRITITNAPTIIVYGFRSEKLGTEPNLILGATNVAQAGEFDLNWRGRERPSLLGQNLMVCRDE